jgi:hypothetical protein
MYSQPLVITLQFLIVLRPFTGFISVTAMNTNRNFIFSYNHKSRSYLSSTHVRQTWLQYREDDFFLITRKTEHNLRLSWNRFLSKSMNVASHLYRIDKNLVPFLRQRYISTKVEKCLSADFPNAFLPILHASVALIIIYFTWNSTNTEINLFQSCPHFRYNTA